MSRHVFSRGGEGLPIAARGSGAEIFDTDGRRYLDGSGGAIVVGVGHGVDSVSDAIAEQARQIVYVHGTMFTTDVLEAYADELAPLLPLESPWIYPVSGGSEAVETALKMARAYHLARGEDRYLVDRARRRLPRQHPRRPRRVRPGRASRPLFALARVCTAHDGTLRVPLSVPRNSSGGLWRAACPSP